MNEDELLQWDLVPPDLGSNDLFFTEESYKNISTETDLTEQILTKFKELGPYSYTTDKDLNKLNFDKQSEMVASCQISQHPSSEVHVNDLESNQDVHTNNVKDSLAENVSASPESMEVVHIFDGKKASQCMREPPSSCENSLKSVSPPPPEERSQNMLYGRKRIPYPRHSLLSNPDQVFYLAKFIEYKKNQPERGCRQYARFLQLHKKVQKEQKEFSEYLQKVSLEFKEDYAFLQEVAVEYMQKKHEAKLKRLQEYSPFLLPIDKVPISTNKRTAHELQPVKILLQMGEIPVSFPFPKAKTQTVLDYVILQKKFPTDKAQSGKNELPFYDHQVCSEDINAQRLAQKYQCHIVVSSSVLKCLVDNHAPHFEKSWDIPVNVHEYQLEDSEKADHKVVFLDKPFYRQQTTRDINAAFHKISLAARIFHPNHISSHTFHSGSMLHKHVASKDRSTNDAFSEEFSIMDDSFLETFGTSTSHTSSGPVTKKPVAEMGNLAESPQFQSKIICDKKDAKDDLPEEFDGCSDLNPAVSTNEREDSLSRCRRLSDENGSKEQSNMGLISANRFKRATENSDQIATNSVHKELIEVNQNKSKNNNRQEGNSANGNDLSDLGNLDPKKDSLNGESNSFKNTLMGETVSDEQGERTNIQENEKRPGEVKMKINDDHDEIKTAFCISKDESSEEGCDSDSSAAELVIDFENSNTDDNKEEEKPAKGIEMEMNSDCDEDDDDTTADDKEEEKSLKEIAVKIDDEEISINVEGKAEEKTSEGSKIKINDADDDDMSLKSKDIRKAFHILKVKSSEDEVDSDSSAEELVIDFDSSNTDDASENKLISNKTKKPIPNSPRSPVVDAPGSLVPDTPASPICDAPSSPAHDTPASPVHDTPASPIRDTPASPIHDTPASPIRDTPASPIHDTPASPIRDTPASPIRDTPASPIHDTPASPIRDTPASPIHDTPASPIRDTPASPIHDTPASPIRDTPASPIRDTPASPSLSAKESPSQMFDRPLVIIPTESDENVYTFHEIQPQHSNISESMNVRLTKKRKHQTAFVLGPLDSILEKQEELLKTTSQMKSENTETKTTMTGIPEMNTLEQLDDNFYETKSPDNPEDYLQPDIGKNVTFCIWNFGDLRLLVRCKYSSIRKTKRRKNFVYLMPKLEYQVGFGYEQTTLSEASKMWISSLTRHNCFIDRIRINAFTSDIMMEEMLSFEQISKLYNPISSNAFMYNLFRRLYSLKTGSYFVSHNAGEKMSVISQAMPENHHSQALDLKKLYPESIPIGIPSVIPWVPIDPNLLTQYHSFYERVPCTFHPPEQKKSKFGKGKKKKNKKK